MNSCLVFGVVVARDISAKCIAASTARGAVVVVKAMGKRSVLAQPHGIELACADIEELQAFPSHPHMVEVLETRRR